MPAILTPAAGGESPFELDPEPRIIMTQTTSDAIDRIADRIRELRVEYERFFNGALDVPPEEQRKRLESDLRHLRNQRMPLAVDRFRMSQIEARFNSYNELFNRRMRDFEEGRNRRQRAAESGPQWDLEAGVVVGDQAIQKDVVEALYSGLAKTSSQGPRFDLDSFGSYLGKQVAAIRAKTGCEQVRFRLANENGRTKLKAKPIMDAE